MTVSIKRLQLSASAIMLAIATTFAAAPAQAFADDEARRAILDLREQIKRMTEQNQQARLQLADQVDMLRQEVATLRGQVEQLNWQQRLGGNTSDPAQQNAQAPSGTDPQEAAAFDVPMALFKGGKYKDAVVSFEDFLTAYPTSTLAPEARFYQGSARYATKDFKNSITGLQSMVQQFPDHARAPDALLVIAASQTELNNIPGAKTTLERIVKTYPKSNAAETAKSRLKLLQ